jgi:hypothetical protein
MKGNAKAIIYRGKDGWRARVVAANGRIVLVTGEAFARRSYLARKLKRLLNTDAVEGLA